VTDGLHTLSSGRAAPRRGRVPSRAAPDGGGASPRDFSLLDEEWIVPDRLVLRGGFVVSMDQAIGDVPDCDVLVQDGQIVAVAPRLDVNDAEIIDATGTVMIPGFVDTHRHTWETVVRGQLPSCTLHEYITTMHDGLGAMFRPDDVFAGTLLGSLEALNAGVTTIVDWSHCTNTPDHADAAVAALQRAGLRALYAHGRGSGGQWWTGNGHDLHPSDARRVRTRYFASDDQLLTMALALRGPGLYGDDIIRHDWALARELGVRISVHVGMRMTGVHVQAVRELDRLGLLGPDTTYIHCNESTDDELRRIADSGGTVSVAPWIEMIMGQGYPRIGALLRHGIAPTLSVDVVTSGPGDMFTPMRAALAWERIQSFGPDRDVPFAAGLTHRDVLRFATLDGARACGLDHKVGSITPGKDADLVMIRADDVNTFPLLDPVATVVSSADVSNVDSVLVRGQFRKRGRMLVDVDLPALRTLAQSSSDHVRSAAGMPMIVRHPPSRAATQTNPHRGGSGNSADTAGA